MQAASCTVLCIISPTSVCLIIALRWWGINKSFQVTSSGLANNAFPHSHWSQHCPWFSLGWKCSWCCLDIPHSHRRHRQRDCPLPQHLYSSSMLHRKQTQCNDHHAHVWACTVELLHFTCLGSLATRGNTVTHFIRAPNPPWEVPTSYPTAWYATLAAVCSERGWVWENLFVRDQNL